jgi:uncharacterized protein (TIGR03067 family)
MKMLTPAAVLAATLAVTSFASADEKAAKGDLAKLQGTWKAKIAADLFKVSLEIKDQNVVVTGSTGEGELFEFKGDFSLDDTAKPHKTIDWKNFTSPDGEVVADVLAIYEFTDADTLKLCSGGPGNGRPADFKAPDGGQTPGVVVLTREKETQEKDKPEKKPAAAPKDDLAKFQGNWMIQIGRNNDFTIALSFKGTSVALKGTRPNGEDFALKGEIKLDESAKPHKTIDWVGFKRPDGDDAPPNLGIYEILDDGAIRVCSGGPGNERPSEFKAGEDGPPHLGVMKRAKE